MTTSLPPLAWLLALASATAVWSAQAADTAQAIIEAGRVKSGLCVVVPAGDAGLLADLAADGRMLVHGIAADTAQAAALRAAIDQHGLGGQVTVAVGSPSVLPFPSRMVNLLVVDADLLGDRAPAAAEIARVVVPLGAAVVKRDGRWTATRPSWPEQLDDWTHFSYGPEANAVSREQLAVAPTSLRWVAGVRGQDLRVAGGMLVSPLVRKFSWHANETGEMRGRDAFNGLLRWTTATGLGGSDRPNEWAVGDGLVFHFPHHRPCHAVATDMQTGQVVRTFDQGVRRPEPDQLGHGKSAGVAVQLVCGDRLIQSYGRLVVALSIATGKRLWQYEPDDPVGFMSATSDGRRVFLHEVSDWTRGRARWGKHQTVRVTCLLDGKLAWKNDRIAGEEVSDLVYHDDALYVFDPTTNLGDDSDADIWKLAVDDGRILWAGGNVKQNYNISLNSLLVRDGRIYCWGPFNNLRAYDHLTGQEINLSINGYNQRCTRMSATRDWLIFGLSSWFDRDGNWTQTAVGRSDCSLPAYPAHGQVYFGSNVTCTCINPVRGIVAVAAEEPVERVDDADRLETMDKGIPAAPRAVDASPAASGPIATEWRPDPLVFYYLADQTPAAIAGELTLTADVHRHRLVARRGEQIAWTFIAGGRIYAPPRVRGERCYFGAADGYIYCLETSTGRPLWRFLAAPAHRNVIAFGQLESTWPVYNVVEHEGLICAAAGRHMELDGGIWLWGLDPTSGRPQWRAVMHAPPRIVPAGQKSPKQDRAFTLEVAQRGALNGGLTVAAGRLELRSPYFDKRGSSPSTTGYIATAGEEASPFSYRTFPIDTAAWNGKTIDPRDLVELPKKK